MNFKRLFIALAAVAVVLTGCKEKEDLGSPRIKVDPAELAFEEGVSSKSVALTSTRDWKVKSAPDWVGLSIQEGKASVKPQSISVTVLANSGYDRSGSVIFTSGLVKCALTVNQAGAQGELKKGSGTKADPYTVFGVNEYLQELGSGVVSPDAVCVKGKVSRITEEFSADFGNATFFISDDGSFYGTDDKNIDMDRDFYAYRVKFFKGRKWTAGDPQIKLGDDVILYGKVVLYKGNTPETDFGSGPFLFSLNGKDEGGVPDTQPDTPGDVVTGTVAQTIAVADNSNVVVNEALVAAISKQGIVVTDGTANVYVYFDSKTGESVPSVAIGDKVKVEATKATYGGVPEFKIPSVTKISSGNTVNYPEPKDITKSAESYSSTVTEYIRLEGTLSISGNYFNITIPGVDSDKRQGSLSAPLDVLGADKLDGQDVAVTGYFSGLSGSGKYINIVVTDIAPADPNAKRCTVSPDKISVGADATSATLQITANAAWTVSSDNADVTVAPASGESNATVTLSFPANTGEQARTANIRVVCEAAGVDITVPLTQSRPSSGNEFKITVDFSTAIDGFPQSKGTTDGTYTLSGYEFVFHAADAFYQFKYNDALAMLIGKADSYIKLPVVDGKALVGVQFLTGDNASEKVVVDIAKEDGTRLNVNTASMKKATEYNWTVSGEVGVRYKILVTNANNAQFKYLTLIYN